MANIPPNWLGGVIQTQGATQRAGAERARQQAAAGETAGGVFANQLQDIIAAGDRDTEVFADAEGQGGRGRPDQEEVDPTSVEDGAAAPPPSMPGHLDLEA